MKRIIFFCTVLLAIACVTQKDLIKKWRGASTHDVVMNYGPPTSQDPDGATGKILTYVKKLYYPAYHVTQYEYTMFYIDSSDKVYHMLVKTENEPPKQVDVNIR